MKILGYTLHAATIATVLAAIWTGHTWQFALTGLVLFLAGAAVLGSEGLKRHGTPSGAPQDAQDSTNGHQVGPDDSGRTQSHTGHSTTDRPTYGKPSKENDQR